MNITNFQAKTLPHSKSIEVCFGEEQLLDPQYEGVIGKTNRVTFLRFNGEPNIYVASGTEVPRGYVPSHKALKYSRIRNSHVDKIFQQYLPHIPKITSVFEIDIEKLREIECRDGYITTQFSKLYRGEKIVHPEGFKKVYLPVDFLFNRSAAASDGGGSSSSSGHIAGRLMHLSEELAEKECLVRSLQDKVREQEELISQLLSAGRGMDVEAEVAVDPKLEKVMSLVEKLREQITVCPIDFDTLEDPVVAPSGDTFSKAVISEALRRDPRNPMTREPLRAEQLYPNKLAEDVVEVVNELAELLDLD